MMGWLAFFPLLIYFILIIGTIVAVIFALIWLKRISTSLHNIEYLLRSQLPPWKGE